MTMIDAALLMHGGLMSASRCAVFSCCRLKETALCTSSCGCRSVRVMRCWIGDGCHENVVNCRQSMLSSHQFHAYTGEQAFSHTLCNTDKQCQDLNRHDTRSTSSYNWTESSKFKLAALMVHFLTPSCISHGNIQPAGLRLCRLY